MAVDDPIFSSNALAIATDDNFDAQGDAYDGSAVKVEPSAGEIAQGAIRPARQIGAQAVNWILNQFSQIFSALIANAVEHEDRLDDDDIILADHESRLDTAEAWIADSSPRIKILEFLASGTFEVPPRCVAALSYGCGGGGAGGGGKAGDNTVDRWIAGGAGGGGAWATLIMLRNLVPGETINVDVGAGGAAYLATLGGTGGNGGDTIVRRGATPLATHYGAQGGRGAVGAHAITYWVHHTFGGLPIRDLPVMLIGAAAQGIRYDTATGASSPFGRTADGGPHSLYIPMQPGQGGYGSGGSIGPASSAGSRNPIGNYAGGAAGIKGPDGRWDFQDGTPYEPGFDTRRGGGGGGGGGAGPFGPGGQGGAGAYGDPWSAPQPTNGASAGNNSGAGGGGGGSCGWFDDVEDVGGGNGCFGGNGGSGRDYIILVQESGT